MELSIKFLRRRCGIRRKMGDRGRPSRKASVGGNKPYCPSRLFEYDLQAFNSRLHQ